MPIGTVEELHSHLRLAGIVELTTIPTYLYAMYSLDDLASDAAKLIRSVAVEEMLHLALVGNLLLGTGGEPRFYSPDSVPSYPLAMPHHIPETIV
ncbi:MAG: ferritin-like protein, partial [Acidimicrobiia bacterium]|nr:ferritin-like protein [Acidimicrobiia bacterium]